MCNVMHFSRVFGGIFVFSCGILTLWIFSFFGILETSTMTYVFQYSGIVVGIYVSNPAVLTVYLAYVLASNVT